VHAIPGSSMGGSGREQALTVSQALPPGNTPGSGWAHFESRHSACASLSESHLLIERNHQQCSVASTPRAPTLLEEVPRLDERADGH
jgi:hypothetical protein